ncbi:MAG: class I SAM-dependent methyltransferase [Bacteroidota bacterium]
MTEDIYNPEFVKDLFNRMSNSYERVNYITSFGFSIRWRKQFVDELIPYDTKIEVIDLLTGMGEAWTPLKKTYPNSNLTGLDFSTEMLKSARIKNDLHFNKKINILQQDILDCQLPSNYFDIVVCAFGLKTFDSRQLKVLATETYRILKPGGQFSFIEVSKPKNIILKTLYSFYLGKIIPILGRLLLGNPSEYKMLWHYTDKFENAIEANQIFQSVGFASKYKSYFYGCATGFKGKK